MCGLVAIHNPHGPVRETLAQLSRMCGVMAHRGPDHQGSHGESGLLMGHQRLSIIDLSSHANQPMEMADCVLVYNGEIYNFIELRRTLEREHGCRFATHSDTEVLLQAYRVFGPACVKHFNGMFAFVLWDRQQQRLVVARDRFGVKPLFWHQAGDGSLYFASDIKSLWELFPPGELDREAVAGCLANGFFANQETSTPGIRRFPAAHLLVAGRDGLHWERYWELSATPERKLSFNDAVAGAAELLDDAVRLRLRSDVPLGCFLSGGIDSSLITALVSQQTGRAMHTFSIGVDSPRFDESPYAYQVARRYNTHHHHCMLDATSLGRLPDIVWYYADLFGDSSALPAFYVAEAAARELKVVFTGDGGDEGFGGYPIPFAAFLARPYRRLPQRLRRALDQRLAAWHAHPRTPQRWFYRFNQMSLMDAETMLRTFTLENLWGREYANRLSPPFPGADVSAVLRDCRRSDPVDQVLYAEIRQRLVNDYLVKVDMSTMAHSLEGRSPFMDYRLMAFAFSLPRQVLFHHWQRKAVLKKLAERHFDRAFVHRRKMGFSIPLGQWLRDERVFPALCALLRRPGLLHEFLPPPGVEEALAAFQRHPDLHATRIWMLLWFQLWEGLFVSRRLRPGLSLYDAAEIA